MQFTVRQQNLYKAAKRGMIWWMKTYTYTTCCCWENCNYCFCALVYKQQIQHSNQYTKSSEITQEEGQKYLICIQRACAFKKLFSFTVKITVIRLYAGIYEIFTINHVKLCLAHAFVVVYFSDEDEDENYTVYT